MTHNDLVKKASKWLKAQGCGLIITEMSGRTQEPDAIGWYPCYSILIECKATRADFLRDKHKPWNRGIGKSMGDKRYYLAPSGIIKIEELPNGWGLLEPSGKGLKIIRYPLWSKEKNWQSEISLLISAFRRVEGIMPNGVSARFYQYETKNRATVGIGKPCTPIKKGESDETP